MYLLPAGALFAELGYRQVFDRLCAGLADLAPCRSSGSALRQARQRLGATPLRVLSDLVRGPVATSAAATRWRGLLVAASYSATIRNLYSAEKCRRLGRSARGPPGLQV
ncbi:transposase domain-containing protein, partial [Micrococcus luteus]|uniref:transposase domain-containing protein n=1 Tax=Micrococcus luteus TaxID=1270 RepID=UPI003321D23A